MSDVQELELRVNRLQSQLDQVQARDREQTKIIEAICRAVRKLQDTGGVEKMLESYMRELRGVLKDYIDEITAEDRRN